MTIICRHAREENSFIGHDELATILGRNSFLLEDT